MLRVIVFQRKAFFSSKTEPIPAACVTVFRQGFLNKPNNLEVLLVKRLLPPKNGFWALPGGKFDSFVDKSLSAAAKRELFEETNLKTEVEPSYYHKHTAGEGKYLLHHFLALNGDKTLDWSKARATSDAMEIGWINVDKILNNEWNEPMVDELPGVLEIAKKHFLSKYPP